jgi:hypothetical protein
LFTGLLNAADTVQWVRINKAYLGEGDAYVMAQVPDSINYPDILDVKIEEYNEGDVHLKSIFLIRDSSIVKEPGIFATTPNILYRTNGIDRINQDNNYKLVIYNRESGKTVTAKTDVVVDSIFMTNPFSTTQQINWYGPAPFTVKWTTVPEGVVYQLTIRFHYTEVNLANSSDSQPKYIDWPFPQQVATNTSQTQSLGQVINKDDFYYYVKNQVSPNPDVKRIVGPLDFIFTVAASEFYTYIEVNKPPSGVNQSIPQYTNVDGGLGIFSSRLNQGYNNYVMAPQSKDSLISGSITGGLQFVLF